MDKSSSKKRKKSSERRDSSYSSSEDDNHKRKRRLKEIKQGNSRGKFRDKFGSSSHREPVRGERSVTKIKKSKKGGKLKDRKREYSIDESSSDSTSEDELNRKRQRKRKKKERKKLRKEKRKKNEQDRKRKEDQDGNCLERDVESKGMQDVISGPMPQIQKPAEEAKRRGPMVPMTKEEYEKQQSKVRRVFDPDTGRNRLVKGDGEIIEEAVSYQRHKEIYKLAQLGDSVSFEKSLGLN